MSRDWRHYLRSVSREFDVPVTSILARDQHKAPSRARQALYHIMRHERGLKYQQIGQLLQRHHAAVHTGAARADWFLAHDQGFKQRYERAVA